MRKNDRRTIYFLPILGISIILISFIVSLNNNQSLFPLFSDVTLKIGIVILSIFLVDRLWTILGGEPLQNQVSELKELNELNRTGTENGLIKIYTYVTEVDAREWLDLISSSKSNIDISSYTLNDLIARPRIWDLLQERAREGVQVRLLLNSSDNIAMEYVGHENLLTIRDQISEFEQKCSIAKEEFDKEKEKRGSFEIVQYPFAIPSL
jgi:hypothetical protein